MPITLGTTPTPLEDRSAPEPRFDRWGRYLITPADGGTPVGHTRATTWAKALDDMEGLINWSMRRCAAGLATRPDLYAQAVAHADDDKALRRIVDDAKEAGGSSTGANLGTALHKFTELADLGEPLDRIPQPHRDDVEAYLDATRRAGLRTSPRFMERIAVVHGFTVAGRFDRIYREADGRLIIGDLKTGKLDWAILSISVQLALYANASTLYNPEDETHEPMPPVRKDRALIVHLPVGQARCELVEVDIDLGWKFARFAGKVREARAIGRRRGTLTTPYTPPGEPARQHRPASKPEHAFRARSRMLR